MSSSPVALQDNIQLSSTGVVRAPLQLGPFADHAERADRADRMHAEGSNDTPSPTAFGNQQREKPLGFDAGKLLEDGG